MSTKNGSTIETPVKDGKSKKVLTIEDVNAMVKRDLSVVTAFLQACQDPDVANAIGLYLHGKYMNALHREELDKQGVLDIEAGRKARQG